MGDDGSAVAGFVLVSALVTAMFLGLVQVAIVLHVRATLVDCASQGARLASRSGVAPADGEARTRELVLAALGSDYAEDVTATTAVIDGLPVVEVTVVAPLPVIGLWGPDGATTARAHALIEDEEPE